MKVKFYDTVDDSLLKFAVIVAKSNGSCASVTHLMMLLADNKEDKASFKRVLDITLSQLDNTKL